LEKSFALRALSPTSSSSTSFFSNRYIKIEDAPRREQTDNYIKEKLYVFTPQINL
jgi:hypothetical protein